MSSLERGSALLLDLNKEGALGHTGIRVDWGKV